MLYLFYGQVYKRGKMQRKQRTVFIQILLQFLLMSCDQAYGCENKSLIFDDKKCEKSDPNFQGNLCSHMEGGPLSINTMKVGDGFREEVIHLEVDFEHNIWILRKSRKSPENRVETRFLEKYDLNGKLLVQISQPRNVHFNAFSVAKNGQLILVEKRLISEKIDELDSVYGAWVNSAYHIWFKRFDSNGGLLQEAPLQDSGSEKELLVYDFTGNGQPVILQEKLTIDDGNKPRVFFENHAILLLHEDGVYFLAWTYGVKLYRLNEFFEVKWSRQIMPYHLRMGIQPFNPYGQEKLAVDENKNVYVAHKIYDELFTAWKQHFEKEISWKGSEGILITRFSADGVRVDSRILGKDYRISVAGLDVKNDVITIGGSIRTQNKFNRPNDTSELDLVFMKANFQTGEIVDYKTIDIKREDLALDFHIDENGIGIFSGANDFLQMDTSSTMEFGQGFILKVNENGNIINYLPLRGARHTRIDKVALFPKENPSSSFQEIVFGGTYNGPITHTANAQTFKEGMLGVLKW